MGCPVISNMDDLVAAMTGPRHRNKVLRRVGFTGIVAAHTIDFWRASGLTSGPVPAASGETLDHTSQGSLMLLPSPGTDELLYLTKFEAYCTAACPIYLVDRIWHNSGLSIVSTAVQTVNTPPLPARAGDGTGLSVYLTVWTGATSSTAADVTLNYTDPQGNPKTSVTPALGLQNSNRMQRLQLAPGDHGVRSVQSIQLTAVTGAAGSLGIVLAKRLAEAHVPNANYLTLRDIAQVGLPVVPNDACLSMLLLSTGTSTGDVLGSISVTAG